MQKVMTVHVSYKVLSWSQSPCQDSSLVLYINSNSLLLPSTMNTQLALVCYSHFYFPLVSLSFTLASSHFSHLFFF